MRRQNGGWIWSSIFAFLLVCELPRGSRYPCTDFLDSWQQIFGCVFVSYQRRSWAIFLLAAPSCILPYCCIEALSPDSED
jgi:hypothetical protein